MPPPQRHYSNEPTWCRWGPVSTRLVVHVLALGLVLIVVNLIIPVDASLGTDDGAYGGQVHALRNGSWTLDRPLPVVAAENEGWSNAAITDSGPLPYTTNPAYALVLATAAAIAEELVGPGGDGGDPVRYASALAMQAIPALGLALAAVAAWLLAAEWSRSGAPLAFWLVAAGPLLVTSTGLWAHTLAAAAAGFTTLGIVRFLGRGSVGWLVFAALSLAALALLRTESGLWIASVCVTTIALSRSARAWLVVGLAGGVGAGAWVASRLWGMSLRADRLPIVTDARADGGFDGWLPSRLPAGWELFASTVRPGPGPLIVLLATVLVAVAASVMRTSGDRPAGAADGARAPMLVGVVLLVAAAVYFAVVVAAPGQLVAGLVPAWPVLFLLLAVGRHRNDDGVDACFGSNAERSIAARPFVLYSSALFALLILLTQYGNGGGLQWGGRYLAVAYVPVAAVAAVVGAAWFRRYRFSMAALLVAPTVVGLVASYELHTTHHNLVAALDRRPAEVVVTDVRPLPRLAWTALPTAFYIAERDDVVGLLDRLDGAGVETVTVHGIGSVDVDGVAGYRLVDEVGGIRWLAK